METFTNSDSFSVASWSNNNDSTSESYLSVSNSNVSPSISKRVPRSIHYYT